MHATSVLLVYFVKIGLKLFIVFRKVFKFIVVEVFKHVANLFVEKTGNIYFQEFFSQSLSKFLCFFLHSLNEVKKIKADSV